MTLGEPIGANVFGEPMARIFPEFPKLFSQTPPPSQKLPKPVLLKFNVGPRVGVGTIF